MSAALILMGHEAIRASKLSGKVPGVEVIYKAQKVVEMVSKFCCSKERC